MRTIEVLLDRDAVASGAAAGGHPWQHYDLGHGYCSYTFFEQCPHRMACARCDFYIPKESGKAQLLEAQDNLQRMLASIPLTDDERAAVDDGQAALDSLLGKLADVPTPAGATPPADRTTAGRDPAANHRRPAGQKRATVTSQIPQNRAVDLAFAGGVLGVGVGPERPAWLSPGGFLRPALRTGRAASTASGSPRVHAVGAGDPGVGTLGHGGGMRVPR